MKLPVLDPRAYKDSVSPGLPIIDSLLFATPKGNVWIKLIHVNGEESILPGAHGSADSLKKAKALEKELHLWGTVAAYKKSLRASFNKKMMRMALKDRKEEINEALEYDDYDGGPNKDPKLLEINARLDALDE